MSAKILGTEKNVVTMELTIAAEDFTAAINQAYQKNKKYFSIQGFRKGKAPRKIIEAHYGKGVFVEDAIDFAFPGAYKDALEETKIKAVTRPTLEKVEKVDEAEGAIFIVKVGVKPEVTLKDYKGAEINKLEPEMTEEDIAAKLAEMQNQNARIISDDEAAAKLGDTVIIDYEGFVDDEPFIGGKDEGHSLELGSNTFIPGFEDQLVGAKKDDAVDVKVTFPEEYHADNLAGKDAVFKVVVKEVQVKELPVLDDEFAKDVSEFDTLDELKADISEKLKEEKTRALRADAERAVIEFAIENAELEVPDLMIEEEVDRSMESMEQQMKAQGISLDDYFKFTGSSREDFRENMKPDAEKNIKMELVLADIAEAEEMAVTEEEMDAEIKVYADAFNHEFEAYKETVDDRMREYLDANIKRKKTVDFLVDAAVQK